MHETNFALQLKKNKVQCLNSIIRTCACRHFDINLRNLKFKRAVIWLSPRWELNYTHFNMNNKGNLRITLFCWELRRHRFQILKIKKHQILKENVIVYHEALVPDFSCIRFTGIPHSPGDWTSRPKSNRCAGVGFVGSKTNLPRDNLMRLNYDWR